MALFYQPDLTQSHLSEEEARHVRVLRIKEGETIELTDGKGSLCQAELTAVTNRKVEFRITGRKQIPPRATRIHLAVAPTKNIDRMEWMVEKCTEIGVDRISFVKCHTSERPRIPLDRLVKIAVSAMKQSGQAWLPQLSEMMPFREFISKVMEAQRFIAYVDESNADHLSTMLTPKGDCVLLIGPEGDFTKEELELALSHGFKKASLGPNRLRTETAAVYAVTSLNLKR